MESANSPPSLISGHSDWPGLRQGWCALPQTAPDESSKPVRDAISMPRTSIAKRFLPLEELRNGHGPIAVLHDAVGLADVAQMGPILPMLSNTAPNLRDFHLHGGP